MDITQSARFAGTQFTCCTGTNTGTECKICRFRSVRVLLVQKVQILSQVCQLFFFWQLLDYREPLGARR
jgi:hypothetical protein